MNLKTFLKGASPSERERLAVEAGTSVAYLVQIAGGWSKASAQLTLRLEKATGGAVHRSDLRPDIYPPEPKRRRA